MGTNVPGGLRAGPNMFGRRTPAADATSTLLSFLQQEQAIASSASAGKGPQQKRQQSQPALGQGQAGSLSSTGWVEEPGLASAWNNALSTESTKGSTKRIACPSRFAVQTSATLCTVTCCCVCDMQRASFKQQQPASWSSGGYPCSCRC